MSNNHEDQGFTIVELLIGLTILSLVVVALASALDFSRRVFRTMDDAGRRVDELALLQRILAEALSQVAMPSAVGQPMLLGDHRRLTVLAPGPRVLAATSPVLLNVGPDLEERGLLASWQLDPSGGPKSSLARQLVTPDRRVRFAYFAPDLGWRDAWNESGSLPALVRVQIGHADGGGTGVPLSFQVRQLVPVLCEHKSPDKLCKTLQ